MASLDDIWLENLKTSKITWSKKILYEKIQSQALHRNGFMFHFC